MLKNQHWAILPAAGIGQRMQADKPKQYLPLGQKTVIEHSLDRLLSMDEIEGVVISISDTDEYWHALNYQSKKPVLIAKGGCERCDSVLNALELLAANAKHTDSVWVLVHDAARPCVRTADIKKLLNEATTGHDGGLLALPVRDTMKRAKNSNVVEKTVNRDNLWHALTPQTFPLMLLKRVLENAIQQGESITDDASAMELAGYSPALVEAHEDNIKITRAFDLKLAALYMKNQMDEA